MSYTIEKIQDLVNRERLTVAQLAAIININANTLAQYLNGTRNPSHFVELYLGNIATTYKTGGLDAVRKLSRQVERGAAPVAGRGRA